MISAGAKEINAEREVEDKTRTRLVKESAVYILPFGKQCFVQLATIGGVSFPIHK